MQRLHDAIYKTLLTLSEVPTAETCQKPPSEVGPRLEDVQVPGATLPCVVLVLTETAYSIHRIMERDGWLHVHTPRVAEVLVSPNCRDTRELPPLHLARANGYKPWRLCAAPNGNAEAWPDHEICTDLWEALSTHGLDSDQARDMLLAVVRPILNETAIDDLLVKHLVVIVPESTDLAAFKLLFERAVQKCRRKAQHRDHVSHLAETASCLPDSFSSDEQQSFFALLRRCGELQVKADVEFWIVRAQGASEKASFCNGRFELASRTERSNQMAIQPARTYAIGVIGGQLEALLPAGYIRFASEAALRRESIALRGILQSQLAAFSLQAARQDVHRLKRSLDSVEADNEIHLVLTRRARQVLDAVRIGA